MILLSTCSSAVLSMATKKCLFSEFSVTTPEAQQLGHSAVTPYSAIINTCTGLLKLMVQRH